MRPNMAKATQDMRILFWDNSSDNSFITCGTHKLMCWGLFSEVFSADSLLHSQNGKDVGQVRVFQKIRPVDSVDFIDFLSIVGDGWCCRRKMCQIHSGGALSHVQGQLSTLRCVRMA